MTVKRGTAGLLATVTLVSACTSTQHRQSAEPRSSVSALPPAAQCTERAQRAREVYGQLLTAVASAEPSSSVVYVVRTTSSGPPGTAHAGPALTADVISCLARGLGRFTRVTVVASRRSADIPHRKGSGPIPLVEGGFIAEFGPAPAGDGKTQVSIDTGGGFGLNGGEYCVSESPTRTVSVRACGAAWIS